MNKVKLINVNGLDISTQKVDDEYYISLTDIARKKNAIEPKDVVKNWMRSRTTIEFLAIWEQLNNPLRIIRGLNRPLIIRSGR